ncbi:MAG: GntR family transcriptional regulator [Firmicutes bacterium]|nr:GntR family transcriptional regulator [Bacillota bacterium]
MMITIDYKDRRPIYQQLMDKIEELAMQGLIQPDEQLPSVRSLAVELAINPNTISRAYGELEKKGITYSVAGKGSFLAAGRDAMLAAGRQQIRRELARLIERAAGCGISKDDFLADAARIYDEGGVLK